MFLIAQVRSVWTVLVAIAYVLAGVTRLCWFDITTDGNTKYFTGVPVTCIAMLLPLIYSVAALFGAAVSPVVIAVALVVMALLFIANIQVKKPTGKAYIVFSVVAIAMVAVLLIK